MEALALPFFRPAPPAAPLEAPTRPVILGRVGQVLGEDPDGLRPYQRTRVTQILAAFEEQRSCLCVMATGLGKTTLFGAIAKHWPGNVLIIAHRDELIQQAAARLRAMTGESIEIEQAAYYATGGRIVVATIQTLARESRLARFSKDRFSLIIVDEAHHSPASSYRAVLDYFPEAKVLGVTATPDRADEMALGKVFDSVVDPYDIADGIQDGWLVPIESRRVMVEGLDLSAVGTVAGDLNQGQLDTAMTTVVEGVVRPTVDLVEDRSTVVFTTSVANAHLTAQLFNELRAGSAVAIDGGMDRELRRAAFRRFESGEAQFLVNVMVATEGWDCPRVSCVAIARPTKSRSLYTQMVGRGLRLFEGKSNCLIIDYAGNSGKHCLIAPEDILGGKYTDEEISLAKELGGQKPGQKPQRNLEMAREELKRRAKKKVTYTSSSFDPFKALGLREGDWVDAHYGARPPSDGQRRALQRFGVDDKLIATLSSRNAGKMLDKLGERVRNGDWTLKQQKLLARYGYVETIPFSDASRLIVALKANGWKPLPRERSEFILTHEPGSD